MFSSDNRATLPSSISSFYKHIKDRTHHKTHAQATKLVSNGFLDVLGDLNVCNTITTPARKLCFNHGPSDSSLHSNASTCMRSEGSYKTRQNLKKVCFTEFMEVQYLDDFKKHVRFTNKDMVRIIPARD